MPDATATLDMENRLPMIPLSSFTDISRLTPALQAIVVRRTTAAASPEKQVTAFSNFVSAQLS